MDTVIVRNKPARADIYAPEDMPAIVRREVWPLYERLGVTWARTITFSDGSQQIDFYATREGAERS